MKNGNQLIKYAIGLVALGITVYVVSAAWKRGQKDKAPAAPTPAPKPAAPAVAPKPAAPAAAPKPAAAPAAAVKK